MPKIAFDGGGGGGGGGGGQNSIWVWFLAHSSNITCTGKGVKI